jgi:hypothetical protein
MLVWGVAPFVDVLFEGAYSPGCAFGQVTVSVVQQLFGKHANYVVMFGLRAGRTGFGRVEAEQSGRRHSGNIVKRSQKY